MILNHAVQKELLFHFLFLPKHFILWVKFEKNFRPFSACLNYRESTKKEKIWQEANKKKKQPSSARGGEDFF